ncbi:MAG: hypothetical protein ABS76_26500 [Pelagibacterium sp. SCN 64-44]|jgi:hypothetical protein|nr:MAG: hypothetical protein ABS76_26500 [Pelagibacterium sp. SCN 64-44]
MADIPTSPPSICELEWTKREDGCFVAPATEIYWDWKNAGVWRFFKAVGMSPLKDDSNGRWFVLWNPAKCEIEANDMQRRIANIRAHRLEVDIKASDARRELDEARAANRERERIERERREQERAERERRRAEADKRERWELAEKEPERIARVRNEARAMLKTWHEFTNRSGKLIKLLDIDLLNRAELAEIESILRETRLKIKLKNAEVDGILVDGKDAVHWPEDLVVECVTALTLADEDRAGIRNKIGWGKGDTSRGHYCYGAILGTAEERARGIKLARQFLVHYRRQLWVKHGIDVLTWKARAA